MSLEDLVGAIRAADGEDAELSAATRLRVRRSLELRARQRHPVVGIAVAVAILFGGSVSWALATGRVAGLWAPALQPPVRAVEPAPPPPQVPPPRRALVVTQRPAPAPSQEHVSPREPVLPPQPEPAPVHVPIALPRPRPATAPPIAPPAAPPIAPPAAPPIEVLYRRAHELHFHGGDPAVTLAAWDAYLAAEPAGRFSVEARYNRAIMLVRLGRYADARAALGPFARGEVEPAGYRQTEAEALVERLAREP
jgi:hypothetical protein